MKWRGRWRASSRQPSIKSSGNGATASVATESHRRRLQSQAPTGRPLGSNYAFKPSHRVKMQSEVGSTWIPSTPSKLNQIYFCAGRAWQQQQSWEPSEWTSPACLMKLFSRQEGDVSLKETAVEACLRGPTWRNVLPLVSGGLTVPSSGHMTQRARLLPSPLLLYWTEQGRYRPLA